MMSDSTFEDPTFANVHRMELKSSGANLDDESQSEQAEFEIQLPPQFSTGTSDRLDFQSSESRRRMEDPSETSSWSMVSSRPGTTTGGDDASVAASSTTAMSGFDILSLNGTTTQKECPRCTFLNKQNAKCCEMCYLLMVN